MRKPNPETQIKREKVQELWEKGLNKSQIAEEMECSPDYVYRLAREMNLDFVGRKRREKETSEISEYSQRFSRFLIYCRTIVYKLTYMEMANKLGITIYQLRKFEGGQSEITFSDWLYLVEKMELDPKSIINFLKKEDAFELLV